ncbi:predicted protein [Plenodomus lingam JN3]|uniref:Predicted protein n=1 Tax=Leptosphaeria maculans (strain JN3 / isolate v23.1.3 / race Av1-4-5-6-7-8) TaxID=985895 RepID=E4ZSF8_LEPMJ|nr:predicted protein [Plenodomus lingam JN3]CBX94338.1 predicted protein [Plenodomus lingam JN3]
MSGKQGTMTRVEMQGCFVCEHVRRSPENFRPIRLEVYVAMLEHAPQEREFDEAADKHRLVRQQWMVSLHFFNTENGLAAVTGRNREAIPVCVEAGLEGFVDEDD